MNDFYLYDYYYWLLFYVLTMCFFFSLWLRAPAQASAAGPRLLYVRLVFILSINKFNVINDKKN